MFPSLADFIELALAASLIGAAFFRPRWEAPVRRFAAKTRWCMALLFLLPIALRLLLLRHHPVPSPDIYDEFGHLLVADTLRHFRLANPPHALSQFFETFFVLQIPTYSSIYPLGQGAVLALGQMAFGSPWAGVLAAGGAFCALCYWMLRGWVQAEWALLGGFLALLQFGPLNQWMNNYWGGSFAAAAGCLVFGALPRLRKDGGPLAPVLLGLGFGLHFLARPYESVFLAIAVAAFLTRDWRWVWRPVSIAALVAFPALALTLFQNHAVTGRWTTLPYTLSQQQYGVPAALTFQPPPVPNRALTLQQQLDYKMQSGFRGAGPETPSNFLSRLRYRIRFYSFYFLPPLYVALFGFLPTLREWRYAWALATVLLFAAGINFFPAFQFHYLAAVVCLFVLAPVAGLAKLGARATPVIVVFCIAHFLYLYAVQFTGGVPLGGPNRESPARRAAVNRELADIPGQLLVFVRYYPSHVFQEEWVFNGADIDSQRVVFARDLGGLENKKLLAHYPYRAAMLLEPDMRPPRLSRYQAETPPEPEKPKPPTEPKKPLLMFEPVK